MNKTRCVAWLTPLLLVPAAATAQTVPPGFQVSDLIPGGLTNATSFALAPDGRVYITQQGGQLRVWAPGTGLKSGSFYNFPVQFSGERGLIGVAIDPNWMTNHYIYVHYCRSSPANGAVIARVTASASNPNNAVSNSRVTVMDLGNYSVTSTQHVGGHMLFGKDNKLYVATGDITDSANSQTLATPWGKILRLNPTPGNPIPSDNPTTIAGLGTPTGNNRVIYAAGLRNPFTFAIHRSTGRIFVNDVGLTDYEEIDDLLPGRNYGWPATEGDFVQSQFPSFTRPHYTYAHGGPGVTGFCIIGGDFYHPVQHAFPPAFEGEYFFADYISGWVKRLDPVSRVVTDFGTDLFAVVDMKVDPQGRLLLLSNEGPNGGRVYRVDYTASLPPAFITHPNSQSVSNGPVQFGIYAAGNRAITYRWRRNGVPLNNDGIYSGVTTNVLTVSSATCATAGAYDCVATNGAGSATSNPASLTAGCYVNCDCSQDVPVFNVADFACFLNKFAAGDPYANCDASTQPPVLNIHDFTCFIEKAAAGCP